MIIKDGTLNLSAEDRKNIIEMIRTKDEALRGQVKMLYGLVYVPAKGHAFKTVNLVAFPTYGDKKGYRRIRVLPTPSVRTLTSEYLTKGAVFELLSYFTIARRIQKARRENP